MVTAPYEGQEILSITEFLMLYLVSYVERKNKPQNMT